MGAHAALVRDQTPRAVVHKWCSKMFSPLRAELGYLAYGLLVSRKFAFCKRLPLPPPQSYTSV